MTVLQQPGDHLSGLFAFQFTRVSIGAANWERTMQNAELSASIIAMRPFVPTKDFDVSKRFYADLGFEIQPLGDGIANARLGSHSFLLQKFFVEEMAKNFMMHLLVTNLDQWWHHVAKLDLPAKYGVQAPRAPKLEPWGLRVAYVFDPSGVLWHIAE